MPTVPQRLRQTDGRTTYDSNTALELPASYELLSMVKSLQVRFVKPSVLTSTRDILKIDLKNSENLNNYTKIDIGFSAEKSVKDLLAAKKVSDKQNLEFRTECRAFLAGVVQKILNKSPLNYSLAKALAAFDPRRMADSSCHDANRTHLRRILKHMIEAGRISDTDEDAVQQQYTVFLDEVIKQSLQFAAFNPTGSSAQERDRVDSLFYDTLTLCHRIHHASSCGQSLSSYSFCLMDRPRWNVVFLSTKR